MTRTWSSWSWDKRIFRNSCPRYPRGSLPWKTRRPLPRSSTRFTDSHSPQSRQNRVKPRLNNCQQCKRFNTPMNGESCQILRQNPFSALLSPMTTSAYSLPNKRSSFSCLSPLPKRLRNKEAAWLRTHQRSRWWLLQLTLSTSLEINGSFKFRWARRTRCPSESQLARSS